MSGSDFALLLAFSHGAARSVFPHFSSQASSPAFLPFL